MRARTLVALMALAGAMSCGGGDSTAPTPLPTGPVAGIFRIQLTTPHSDDGALLFTVSGGPITSADPASGYQVFVAPADANTMRFLVTGNVAGGEVVRLHVPDVSKLAAYRASLSQAASRDTFAPQSLSSYSMTVTQ